VSRFAVPGGCGGPGCALELWNADDHPVRVCPSWSSAVWWGVAGSGGGGAVHCWVLRERAFMRVPGLVVPCSPRVGVAVVSGPVAGGVCCPWVFVL